MTKKLENSDIKIIVLLFLTYTLYCGYYEWACAIISCILLVLLINIKSKNIYTYNSIFHKYIPISILFFIVISNLWAVDKSYSIYGLLKILVIYLWYLLLKQDNKHDKAIMIIPSIGIITILVGIMSLLNNNLKEVFWIADRFGGFFQYANTNALFFLICIIINNELENNKYKRVIFNILLIFALLLTGCRSIILVYICFVFYKLISRSNNIKIYMIDLILLFLFAIIFSIVTGVNNNFGRIFTIINQNSTLWGRILYNKDALNLLIKYPFGMGYMGYSYLISTVQSGVYNILYVHNDILQIALDYGIITLVLIILLIIFQFKYGKQELYKKEILAIIIISSLFDIHFQYSLIIMLMLLMMDFGIVNKEKINTMPIILMYITLFVINIYLFISPFCYYIGNDIIANNIYPRYTPSQIRLLNNQQDRENVKMISNDIIKHNKYEKNSYNNLAYVALLEKDYQTAADMKLRKIILSPYDEEEFIDSQLFEQKILSIEISKEYANKRNIFYKEVKNRTSSIAYKIKDKPLWMENIKYD